MQIRSKSDVSTVDDSPMDYLVYETGECANFLLLPSAPSNIFGVATEQGELSDALGQVVHSAM